MLLDLSDLKSVQEFSIEFKKRFKTLDILINNAGGYATKYKLTSQGFESVFGINYIGGAYLTECLLDILKNTPESRIINVASRRHAQLN
jgi:NAD(P)-dependent dehydrogenase (short-subunit alcohol dehydrogenase family)